MGSLLRDIVGIGAAVYAVDKLTGKRKRVIKSKTKMKSKAKTKRRSSPASKKPINKIKKKHE